jgi:hypothetical protein
MPPPDTRSGPGPEDPATDQTPAPESCPQDNQSGQSNPVRELLDSLVGIEVDGGCDDCPAYQTIERVDVGVYVNRVFHDDTCPWWIRYQATTT